MKKLLFIFVALLFISCNNDDNYYVDYSKSVQITDSYIIKDGEDIVSGRLYGTLTNTSNKNIRVVVHYQVVNWLGVIIGTYKTQEIDIYPFEIKKDYNLDYNYYTYKDVKPINVRVQVVTTF